MSAAMARHYSRMLPSELTIASDLSTPKSNTIAWMPSDQERYGAVNVDDRDVSGSDVKRLLSLSDNDFPASCGAYLAWA